MTVPSDATGFDRLRRPDNAPLLTVQQHILREQERVPGTAGEFSWLMSGITLATKMIAAHVRRAGLTDLIGEQGRVNVQGEDQQKLDVYANETLLHCLSWRESIGFVASEENERPMAVHHGSPSAKYAVVFDPLDGSSNIDVNVSVGAYVLSHEDIRMPQQGRYYSVNEAYHDEFPEHYRAYLEHVRGGGLGRRYSTRYIGSMVADFHRTLLKGGVFLYPPTHESPGGKLRLLYEANPIAFLAEQAGGVATDGRQRVLDVQPASIHQRTPLVVGSPVEMAAFARVAAGA